MEGENYGELYFLTSFLLRGTVGPMLYFLTVHSHSKDCPLPRDLHWDLGFAGSQSQCSSLYIIWSTTADLLMLTRQELLSWEC